MSGKPAIRNKTWAELKVEIPPTSSEAALCKILILFRMCRAASIR